MPLVVRSSASLVIALAVVWVPLLPPEHIHRAGIEGATRWSHPQAAIQTVACLAVLVGMFVMTLARHERFLEGHWTGWPFHVPWDASWPSPPVVSAAEAVAIDAHAR
jgi:hypothetical protein